MDQVTALKVHSSEHVSKKNLVTDNKLHKTDFSFSLSL